MHPAPAAPAGRSLRRFGLVLGAGAVVVIQRIQFGADDRLDLGGG
jgi:hypothetical protein